MKHRDKELEENNLKRKKMSKKKNEKELKPERKVNPFQDNCYLFIKIC